MTKTAFAELLQKTARAQRRARRLSSLQKCAQLVGKPYGNTKPGPRRIADIRANVATSQAANQPRRQYGQNFRQLQSPLNPAVAKAIHATYDKPLPPRALAATSKRLPVTKAQQARKPLTPGGVQATPRVNPLDDITNRLHKGFSQLRNDPKAYFSQLGKRLGFQ